VRNFFADKRGVFKFGRPHFLMQNIRFFKIYSVSTRTRGRGLSQFGNFTDKGEGVDFTQFCADVLCVNRIPFVLHAFFLFSFFLSISINLKWVRNKRLNVQNAR